MEFWGAEVLPSKPAVVATEENTYLHVSSVALGDTKGSPDNERVIVRVQHLNREYVLGTLVPGKCDQIPLDLIFGETVSLSHNSKTCKVYFTGYRTEAAGEDEEDESSDEEERTLFAVKPEEVPRENGKPAKTVVKTPVGKPTKPGAAKHAAIETPKSGTDDGEDEDDSDDDDDDGDDDMESMDDDDDSDEDEFDELNDEDDSDDEDESDDEEAVQPPRAAKKRPAESPAVVTPLVGKRIKTPSGKSGKGDALQKTPKQQTPASADKKTDKKGNKNAPKTPTTDSKPKASKAGTPGSDSKASSGGKLGQHRCEECSRNFQNESALTQHNTAKHKK